MYFVLWRIRMPQWPQRRFNSPETRLFIHPLFGLTSKKMSKPTLLALCEDQPPVTGGSPHKGPWTRKAFLFHDLTTVRRWDAVTLCIWWRHQMETFSALLALCAGNSPVTREFPPQKLVTRSFDVFFDLQLNKWLCKQSRRWWFETPSRSLWRHCNEHTEL